MMMFWLGTLAFIFVSISVLFGILFFSQASVSENGRPISIGLWLAVFNLATVFFAIWFYRKKIPDLVVLIKNAGTLTLIQRRHTKIEDPAAVQIGTVWQEDIGGCYSVALRSTDNKSHPLVNSGTGEGARDAAEVISKFLGLPIEG